MYCNRCGIKLEGGDGGSNGTNLGDSFIFLERGTSTGTNMFPIGSANNSNYLNYYKKKNYIKCTDCLSQLLLREAAVAKDLTEKRKVSTEVLFKLIQTAPIAGAVSSSSSSSFNYLLNASKFDSMADSEEVSEVSLQIEQLERELAFLTKTEKQLDEQIAESQAQLHEWKQDIELVTTQVEGVREEMERLSSSTALNDSFHIWEKTFSTTNSSSSEGGAVSSIATINGLKLGRLANQSNWKDEVSFAFSELSALLVTLARMAGFAFAEYEIVPLGMKYTLVMENSTGVADCLFLLKDSNDATFEQLFKTAEARKKKMRLSSKGGLQSFNRAMVSFACCVKEFCAFACDSDRGVELKIRDKLVVIKLEIIKNQKESLHDALVNGLSIQTNGSEADCARWSEACKYLLGNVKWLLVFVAK